MSEHPVTLMALLLLGLPAAGGVLIWSLGPRLGPALALRSALVLASLPLMLGAAASFLWLEHGDGRLVVERHPWIAAIGAEFAVGVDGLSLSLLLLSGLVVPWALAMGREMGSALPRFCGLALLLQASVSGVFLSVNFFPWFLFWELCLIPAFFLIRFDGGREQRKASMLFFLYTFLGSLGLLLGFLGLLAAAGTLDFVSLADGREELPQQLAQALGEESGGQGAMRLLFLLAFLGVAVKAPLWPLHSWQPMTYARAPAPAAMILSGLLSKMGIYALLRLLLPIFPQPMQDLALPLLALTVLSVVVPAILACASSGLRSMVAYSSINHLGYCFLGVLAYVCWEGEDRAVAIAALSGTGLQLFNHGIVVCLLFFLLWRLERRTGIEPRIGDYGGLRFTLPRMAAFAGVALFATLGLPGLSLFIGEFLIFRGVFASVPWAAALSTLGLLLTAAFALTAFGRIFSGPPSQRWERLADLGPRETLAALLAVFLIVATGLWPQWLLSLLEPAFLGGSFSGP